MCCKLNYKKPEFLGHQLLYLPTLTIIAMFIHNYSKYLLFMSNAFITPCNITPKPVKFMSRKDIIALRCAALANLLLCYNLILIKTVIYSMILLSPTRMMWFTRLPLALCYIHRFLQFHLSEWIFYKNLKWAIFQINNQRVVYRNLATNKAQFIVIHVKARQFEHFIFFYKKWRATVETGYAIVLLDGLILKLGSVYLLNSSAVNIISVGFIKKGACMFKLLNSFTCVALNILLLFVYFYYGYINYNKRNWSNCRHLIKQLFYEDLPKCKKAVSNYF